MKSNNTVECHTCHPLSLDFDGNGKPPSCCPGTFARLYNSRACIASNQKSNQGMERALAPTTHLFDVARGMDGGPVRSLASNHWLVTLRMQLRPDLNY